MTAIATATNAGTPPTSSHRVSRCVVCDLGVTWKGAAARPACPRCGGALTTSTRQRRAGFILLEGAELTRAERLPNGLELGAAWFHDYELVDGERIVVSGGRSRAHVAVPALGGWATVCGRLLPSALEGWGEHPSRATGRATCKRCLEMVARDAD